MAYKLAVFEILRDFFWISIYYTSVLSLHIECTIPTYRVYRLCDRKILVWKPHVIMLHFRIKFGRGSLLIYAVYDGTAADV